MCLALERLFKGSIAFLMEHGELVLYGANSTHSELHDTTLDPSYSELF